LESLEEALVDLARAKLDTPVVRFNPEPPERQPCWWAGGRLAVQTNLLFSFPRASSRTR